MKVSSNAGKTEMEKDEDVFNVMNLKLDIYKKDW